VQTHREEGARIEHMRFEFYTVLLYFEPDLKLIARLSLRVFQRLAIVRALRHAHALAHGYEVRHLPWGPVMVLDLV
jgi:hypothetical protein